MVDFFFCRHLAASTSTIKMAWDNQIWLLFYARRPASAGGGCSGTPYRNIKILIPCVVGHLPGNIHTIPTDSVVNVLKSCYSVAEIHFLLHCTNVPVWLSFLSTPPFPWNDFGHNLSLTQKNAISLSFYEVRAAQHSYIEIKLCTICNPSSSFSRPRSKCLRPIFNFTLRGKLWPPGAKLSPRGQVIPWVWSSLFAPPFF
jgi:hypothetical protein